MGIERINDLRDGSSNVDSYLPDGLSTLRIVIFLRGIYYRSRIDPPRADRLRFYLHQSATIDLQRPLRGAALYDVVYGSGMSTLGSVPDPPQHGQTRAHCPEAASQTAQITRDIPALRFNQHVRILTRDSLGSRIELAVDNYAGINEIANGEVDEMSLA